MRNCSHLSYLTTAITTYPPKSSWKDMKLLYCFAIDFANLSLFRGLHCTPFLRIVEIVACLVAVEVVTSIRKTALAIHLLCGLLRMGTRERWKYCSSEITLAPINQICIAKCQARQIRLRRPGATHLGCSYCTREWRRRYSGGARSTPTSRANLTGHHSSTLLGTRSCENGSAATVPTSSIGSSMTTKTRGDISPPYMRDLPQLPYLPHFRFRCGSSSSLPLSPTPTSHTSGSKLSRNLIKLI